MLPLLTKVRALDGARGRDNKEKIRQRLSGMQVVSKTSVSTVSEQVILYEQQVIKSLPYLPDTCQRGKGKAPMYHEGKLLSRLKDTNLTKKPALFEAIRIGYFTRSRRVILKQRDMEVISELEEFLSFKELKKEFDKFGETDEDGLKQEDPVTGNKTPINPVPA
ncbi:hypothetical protein Tco_0222765 [Tanacetum coccineum]